MPRPYDSPARRARKDRTRRQVVGVAARLFAERGYSATTLRLIAQEAGVSLERVSAVGGKPALLLAAVEEAINDGEPLGLVERSDIAPAWAGKDLRSILAALVDFVVASDERLDTLTAAWAEARRTDTGLSGAYEQRMNDMRAAGRAFVHALIARGLVDPELDPASVADKFWAAAHHTQYDLLVNTAGWTSGQFRAWLLERAVLLMPRPGTPPAEAHPA